MEQKEKMSLVEYTDIYGKICENTDLISADLFDESVSYTHLTLPTNSLV